MDLIRETIQTVGALAAIVLLIVRLPAELHLVRVRCSFHQNMKLRGDEDLSPDATFSASIHNLGREMELASVVTGIGEYGEWDQGLPKVLKRGQHHRNTRDVAKFEDQALEISNAFDVSPMKDEDIYKLNAIFTCGEGCRHEAKLDRAGRKAVKAYIDEFERCAAIGERNRTQKIDKPTDRTASRFM